MISDTGTAGMKVDHHVHFVWHLHRARPPNQRAPAKRLKPTTGGKLSNIWTCFEGGADKFWGAQMPDIPPLNCSTSTTSTVPYRLQALGFILGPSGKASSIMALARSVSSIIHRTKKGPSDLTSGNSSSVDDQMPSDS